MYKRPSFLRHSLYLTSQYRETFCQLLSGDARSVWSLILLVISEDIYTETLKNTIIAIEHFIKLIFVCVDIVIVFVLL